MGEVKAKVDSTGVVLYYKPDKKSKRDNANLLQNRAKPAPTETEEDGPPNGTESSYEYNGFMSKRAASRVRRIVANYTHCYSMLLKQRVVPITRATTTPNQAEANTTINKVKPLKFNNVKAEAAKLTADSTIPVRTINAKRQIVFITLTLPGVQRHTDNYTKRHLLGKFLPWLIDKGATFWIWRAEIQAKTTGNIHFHILTNQYIPKQSISAKWAEICQRHGYAAYNQTTGKPYPSTNVEGIRSEKGVAHYITKYITKNEQQDTRKVEGRCWGMSPRMARYDSIEVPTELISCNMEEVTEDCRYIKEEKYITVVKGTGHLNILEIREALYSQYFTEILRECGYAAHRVMLLHEEAPPPAPRRRTA